MGIFTKYKTFCVEFLILVLFGWIIMENLMTDGKKRDEESFATTDDFKQVKRYFKNPRTYLFEIDPTISEPTVLIKAGIYPITIQTTKTDGKQYETKCNIGSEQKIFRGFLRKNLRVWVTINETFIEINMNHKRLQKTEDTGTHKPSIRVDASFGDNKVIPLELNLRYLFGKKNNKLLFGTM